MFSTGTLSSFDFVKVPVCFYAYLNGVCKEGLGSDNVRYIGPVCHKDDSATSLSNHWSREMLLLRKQILVPA